MIHSNIFWNKEIETCHRCISTWHWIMLEKIVLYSFIHWFITLLKFLILIPATIQHKYVNVDVDVNNKSDRPEWATAKYHAYFSPKCAFELHLQWMVATGCLLGELVSLLYIWLYGASEAKCHIRVTLYIVCASVPLLCFAFGGAPCITWMCNWTPAAIIVWMVTTGC